MNTNNKILLTLRGLSEALGVSYSYTRAMKKAGFPLIGGRARVPDALRWLKRHPDFRVSDHITTKAKPETVVAA